MILASLEKGAWQTVFEALNKGTGVPTQFVGALLRVLRKTR
jgi:hypothetical protein